MKVNKQIIESEIKSLELALIMEADILATVQEFKHYKRVDSRFTDALKAKGWRAYIVKDKYSTDLVCKPNNTSPVRDTEFRLHVSEMMEKRPITWEQIENELVRYGYKPRLETQKLMLERIEAETLLISNTLTALEALKLTCFDLYYIKRELKGMIEFAKKGEV